MVTGCIYISGVQSLILQQLYLPSTCSLYECTRIRVNVFEYSKHQKSSREGIQITMNKPSI